MNAGTISLPFTYNHTFTGKGSRCSKRTVQLQLFYSSPGFDKVGFPVRTADSQLCRIGDKSRDNGSTTKQAGTDKLGNVQSTTIAQYKKGVLPTLELCQDADHLAEAAAR